MKSFFNGDTRERKYNQSAVEWLIGYIEHLNENGYEFHPKYDENIVSQAKEMEEKQRKQDIINAWNSAYGGDSFHTGEEYYINL